MSKKRLLCIFSILIGISLIWIQLSTTSQNSHLNTLISILHSNNPKLIYKSKLVSSKNFSCKPYKNVTNNFFVNIDGVTYPRFVPLYYNKTIDFECLQKSDDRKRILLWNKYWSTTDYFYGSGDRIPFVQNNCPVTNCEITQDKNLLKESDLVVVHMMEYMDSIPKWRLNDQYWLFYENESPLHSINFNKYNNLFSFSSTYRSDSMTTSIYYAESSFYWQLNNNFNENQNFLEGKDRFAATVISNCNDKMNRLEYIKQLQKHISITIYGKCGLVCPFVECQEFISNKYKFYFAFENTFCNDYITEKFFGILKHNIIPVVLGAGPYDRYVPKSGYINALDYKTPEQLANYLIYLSNNATAYNSYFKWKKYITFDPYNPFYGHICEWCILLNLNEYNRLNDDPRIKDMNKFWNPAIDCKWPDKSNNSVFRFLDMSDAEGRKNQKSQI